MYSTYFETIDTEQKAYILGLFFADGYVKNGSIKLEENSQQLLTDIANIVGCNPPIYSAPREDRFSTKGQYGIHMGREAKNIASHIGLHKEYLPNLSEDLWPHFIRGLIDGDGCISLEKRYKQVHPNSIAQPGEVFILLNNLKHAEFIQNLLCEKLNINKNKITIHYGTGFMGVYKIRWSGTKVPIKIREFIYKDATVFLERKKKLFDLLSVGESHKITASKGAAGLKLKLHQNILVCKYCKKEFQQNGNRQIYCSKICSGRFRAAFSSNANRIIPELSGDPEMGIRTEGHENHDQGQRIEGEKI